MEKEQEDNEEAEKALLDPMGLKVLHCFFSKLCTLDPELRNGLCSKALSQIQPFLRRNILFTIRNNVISSS
jgi:hypothetical protein